MKPFLTHLVRLGAVIALAGAVQACGDDDDDDDSAPTDAGTDAGEAQTGEVRVLHLSPSTGAVDVFVNGTAALPGVTFPASSDFVSLPAGSYDFAAAPAGEGIDAAVISLDDFPLGADESYTLVAWGSVSEGDLPAIAIEEDFSELGANEARLRVVHAAEGIATVDVWAVQVGAPGIQLIDNLAPGASDTIDLDTTLLGALGENAPVVLDVGGDGTGDATFLVPTALLPAGSYVNVYAVNDDGPALYAHSRADSDNLQGPITPQPVP